MRRFCAVVLALLLCFACGCTKIENKGPAGPVKETTTKRELSEAEKVLAGMTVEEKVAQLFFVRPDCLDKTILAEELVDPYAPGVTSLTSEMKEFYSEYPVGGFCLFGKNIVDPEQLKSFCADLHSLNAITPLIATDEEGGRVTRIAGNKNFDVTWFPDMESIAETGNTDNAFSVGKTIGGYLNEYGIDIDLAPVADVNTNPKNPIIGNRAFGGNPQVAADMVSASVSGFHAADTFCCLKHYPGHGDTDTDTHYGYAKTDKTWDELLSCELIPFKAGIDAGADIVMVAHISCPSVSGDETPATLSPEIIGRLRSELGFVGLIATDDLSMGAITNEYTPGEACVLAFSAGCDMLLLSSHLPEAYAGVLAAVNDGTIPMDRLDSSVLRILELKLK